MEGQTHAGNTPGVPLNDFSLAQNELNPSGPSTTIAYSVGGTKGLGSGVSEVKLAVYDLLGREVAVLVNGTKNAGAYEVTVDAAVLACGVFFY